MKKTSFSRKAFVIIAMTFAALMAITACKKTIQEKQAITEPKGINVLLLMSKNYGLNYFLYLDNFRHYGWNITYTGVSNSITACPPVAEQLGVPPITPDILVSDIKDISKYHGLLIMPGSGSYLEVPHAFGDLLDSPEALNLIAASVEKNLAVFATCAGVRVLAAADVISGKKVVGAPKFQTEYEAAGATFLGNDHPPAIEGNIVTAARGLYYNVHNTMAVAIIMENNQDINIPKKQPKEEFIFSSSVDLSKQGVRWAKTYGGYGADGGRAICKTPDNGYLITGYTFSHGSGDADILLIKTDANGKMLWSKTFGGSGTEYGNACQAVKDGYLIVGYTTSYGAGSRDIYLIKLDFNGNEMWSRSYGGPSWDVGTAVCETDDDAYIICGFTHSFGAGEEDVYLIKTDTNGNELWSKTYGGDRYELAHSLYKTSDGGFVIGATTGTFGGANSDFYIIKTDKKGKELWSKSFGNKGQHGYGYDWCSSMNIVSNDGYILSGQTDCNDVQDVYVLKTDTDGNETWSMTFGKKPFYDYGNSVCEIKEGGFIVCGTTKSIDGNNDIYLVKLDAKGNVIWEKTFGGPDSDWGGSVYVTRENEYIILGYTNSYGKGASDVFLAKVANQ
jgi:putative intracellular protease/amidase